MVRWRLLNPHVANAIWLTRALPVWYFSPVAHPLSAGVLSIVPFIGTLGLCAGIVTGIVQRRALLLSFLAPVVVSECYVAIGGAMRGQLRGNASLPGFFIFAAIQVFLIGYLIYRLKGARWSASALAVFSLSYALFASFVAGMAFADDWL